MALKGASNISSPSLTLIAMGLSLVTLFTYLGVWQLNRAEERDIAFKKVKMQMALSPIPISNKNDWNTVAPYQKISIKGRFIEEHTVLIDNALLDGKAGYHIITAFKPDTINQYLAVNRGWVPGTKNRSILPTFTTQKKTITLNGYLKEFQPPPLFFSKTENITRNKNNQPLWLYFDLPLFKKQLDLPLSPYLFIAQANKNGAFKTPLLQAESKEGMHIGYAIQWFVFALFILVLTIKVIFPNKPNKQETQTTK